MFIIVAAKNCGLILVRRGRYVRAVNGSLGRRATVLCLWHRLAVFHHYLECGALSDYLSVIT